MGIWKLLIVVFTPMTILAVLTIILFRNVWKSESTSRTVVQNASLTLFTIAYFFLALEFGFAKFVLQSDGMGFTLSSIRWSYKYWNPINSLGYRDYKHKFDKDKTVFILGDSFAAGHGIKHIDDRFSGVLAKKLGDEWTVAVVAQNGWHPVNEYNALIKHPKKPNLVIVSYFINDIESAAIANGLSRPSGLIKMPNRFIKPFVDKSYVLNWFYWHLYRGLAGVSYLDYLEKAYNDDKIWHTHTLELGNIISYSRQIGADVAFVVWPNLLDVNGSFKAITSKVVAYLAKQNVKCINLSEHLANRDSSDLIVNTRDPHPNVQISKEVGELIYKRIFSE